MPASGYFDIIFSIPLLWGLYQGFRKGLIIELASLLAIALGIYGGIKFTGYTSDLLRQKFEMTSHYLPFISFAVTFIVLVILVHLLAKLIESFVNIASLNLVNKVAGAFFGLLKFGIMIMVIMVVIRIFDEEVNKIPEEVKSGSFFYQLSGKFPFLFDWVRGLN